MAVMVEEGTTNVLPNPLFNPVWVVDSLNGSTCSVEVVEVGGIPTLHIFDIVQPWSGYPRVRTGNFTTTVTGDITTSLRVKSNGAGQLNFNLYDLSITTKWAQAVYPDTNFRRYTVSSNTTYVLGSGYLMPTAGYEYWVQWPQVEQKPYATSFIDGTRADETLTIPTAGVLNPQEGTIEFWWNPLAKTPGTYPSLIHTGTWTADKSKDWLAIYWGSGWGNGDRVGFGMCNKNGTSNFEFNVMLNPQPYTWYYVVAKWSFATRIAKLIVYRPDGTYVSTQATINGDPPTFEGWDKFYVLRGWGDYWANSLIDDLRISSRARTDAEIAAAYQSGQPLVADRDTTYLARFDGTLASEPLPRSLQLVRSYGATLAGDSGCSATVALMRALETAFGGDASLSAVLTPERLMQALMQGDSGLSAVFNLAGSLQALLAGSSSVAGNMNLVESLQGILRGDADLSPVLNLVRSLQGTLQGGSSLDSRLITAVLVLVLNYLLSVADQLDFNLRGD